VAQDSRNGGLEVAESIDFEILAFGHPHDLFALPQQTVAADDSWIAASSRCFGHTFVQQKVLQRHLNSPSRSLERREKKETKKMK
jgi:hypothetical protein